MKYRPRPITNHFSVNVIQTKFFFSQIELSTLHRPEQSGSTANVAALIYSTNAKQLLLSINSLTIGIFKELLQGGPKHLETNCFDDPTDPLPTYRSGTAK